MGMTDSSRRDEPARYSPSKADAEDKRVHGQVSTDKHDPRLRCPKDATFMEKLAVGDFEIDRCAGCGAMWFDALELKKILEARHASELVQKLDIGAVGRVSGGRALGELICPRDRSPLIEVVDPRQPHIKELACTVCGGVLLDKGELRDLSEFTLRERLVGMITRLKKR